MLQQILFFFLNIFRHKWVSEQINQEKYFKKYDYVFLNFEESDLHMLCTFLKSLFLCVTVKDVEVG